MSGILAGVWRFTLVGLAGFTPWIVGGGWFYRTIGEVGLYVTCLVAFLAAAMLLLPVLLDGPQRFKRCAAFFIPAFIAYAVVWCACWFALGGPAGEWLGALAGGSVFTLIAIRILGRPRSIPLALVVVVSTQVLGYFAGDAAMRVIAAGGRPGAIGMAAWGVCYGIGFGAGLGWLIHACRKDVAQADAQRS